MKLARAGAITVFAATGVIATVGLYLTWTLVNSALHPTSLNGVAPPRPALTEPLGGAPDTVPASEGTITLAATGAVPSSPDDQVTGDLPTGDPVRSKPSEPR